MIENLCIYFAENDVASIIWKNWYSQLKKYSITNYEVNKKQTKTKEN